MKYIVKDMEGNIHNFGWKCVYIEISEDESIVFFTNDNRLWLGVMPLRCIMYIELVNENDEKVLKTIEEVNK
jgi:hypothetical protein